MSSDHSFRHEFDYPANGYKPFGYRNSSEMCRSCIDYYQELYDKGLTSSPFPIQCNKHILESVDQVDPNKFESEEEYTRALELIDIITWAYDEFGWEARWYQEWVLSCLPSSEQVFMADGTLKSIADVKVGDKVLAYDPKGCRIFKNIVSRSFNNGVKDVYEIQLENGDKINCTSDHKILTHSKLGKTNKMFGCPSYRTEFVSIDDGLKVGDRVYTANDFGIFGEIDDPALAKVLGYLVTDGYIKMGGKGSTFLVQFCNTNKEILDDYIDCLGMAFPGLEKYVKYVPSKVRKDGITRKAFWLCNVYGKNSDLIRFLQSIGAVDKSTREEKILDFAFKLNDRSLSSFLNACWAGDGCLILPRERVFRDGKRCKCSCLTLTSGNRKFLDKFRLLLKKIGISKIEIFERKDSKSINLRIGKSIDIKKFLEFTGPITGKSDKSATILNFVTEKLERATKDNTSSTHKGRKFSRTSRVRIRSISYVGKQPVYDIQVDTRHNFFANGIVVHNCTSDLKLYRWGRRCLGKGTLVATPQGPIKIEEIQAGQEVYDEYGKPIKVRAVFRNGVKPVYDLNIHGISQASCTLDHVFLTKTDRPLSTKTKQLPIKELGKHNKICRVEVNAPLGEVDVPNAYALGCFLGDGCSTTSGLVISSNDPPIISKIEELVGGKATKSKANYSWYFSSKLKSEVPCYAYFCENKKAHEKTIDLSVIKSWNRQSLLKLLAGLLDTDGSVRYNGKELVISISMQSREIIEAVKYCLLALWQVHVNIGLDSRDKYRNGPLHVISLKHNYHCKRILRDLSQYIQTDRKKYKLEYDNLVPNNFCPEYLGVKPVYRGEEETFDINVDSPSNLYLLANGMVCHNSGKTESMVIEALYVMYTMKNSNVLVCAPRENQIERFFNECRKFIAKGKTMSLSVARDRQNPARIELKNGSKILGFVLNPNQGENSGIGIRGQDADLIILDEAAFVSTDDSNVLFAIKASHPDCRIIAASTASIKAGQFYNMAVNKDIGWKEFWFISQESPNYTDKVERFFRNQFPGDTYKKEVYADFASSEEGVFKADFIERALKDYNMDLSVPTPGGTYILGVDWNKSNGTHMVLLQDNGSQLVMVQKIYIPESEYTQTDAVEKIIVLNNIWNFKYIFVDYGYGHCVGPDTLLQTQDRSVRIEDVEIGEHVLTSSGRYQKILNKVKTEPKRSYIVRPAKCLPTTVSYCHPFLTYNGSVFDKVEESDLGWRVAEELTDSSFIAIAKESRKTSREDKVVDVLDYLPKSMNIEYDDTYVWSKLGYTTVQKFSNKDLAEHSGYSTSTITRLKSNLRRGNALSSTEAKAMSVLENKIGSEWKTGPVHTKFNRYIDLSSDDFQRLLGWYLSEGSASNGNSIEICQTVGNQTERFDRLVKSVYALFPKESITYLSEYANNREVPIRRVIISGAIAYNMMVAFGGKGSSKKAIHRDLLEIDLSRAIRALFYGDGSGGLNNTSSSISISMTSHTLIMQVRQIFINNGILPSIYSIDRGKKNHSVQLRLDIGGDTATIDRLNKFLGTSINNPKRVSRRKYIELENFFLVPVRSVECIGDREDLYDIEVEEDHTFCGNGIVLHNTQVEMLKKYGMGNKASGLHRKVIGLVMNKTLKVRDPFTGEEVAKFMKPFLVQHTSKLLEDNKLILPVSEDISSKALTGLVQQMRKFSVTNYSVYGQPIYSKEDEHTLMAYIIACGGYVMETGVLFQEPQYSTRIVGIETSMNPGDLEPQTRNVYESDVNRNPRKDVVRDFDKVRSPISSRKPKIIGVDDQPPRKNVPNFGRGGDFKRKTF